MKKLIKVTQRDINGTKKNYDSDSCPVARAIERELGDRVCVEHSYYRDAITIESSGFEVTAPRSVSRFVKKFDNKGKKAVKPFNFILNIEEN